MRYLINKNNQHTKGNKDAEWIYAYTIIDTKLKQKTWKNFTYEQVKMFTKEYNCKTVSWKEIRKYNNYEVVKFASFGPFSILDMFVSWQEKQAQNNIYGMG